MNPKPSTQERHRLLKEELQRFVETLRREIDPERIILFGSAAVEEIRWNGKLARPSSSRKSSCKGL